MLGVGYLQGNCGSNWLGIKADQTVFSTGSWRGFVWLRSVWQGGSDSSVGKECCQNGNQQWTNFMKKVCHAPIAVSASKCCLMLRCHIKITLKTARFVAVQSFLMWQLKVMKWLFLWEVKANRRPCGPAFSGKPVRFVLCSNLGFYTKLVISVFLVVKYRNFMVANIR